MKEKIITVNGITTNYKIGGRGEPLLILHGWGGSSDSWRKVIECLEDKFLIVCPDFPGFGKSETPKNVWDLDDYVNWLQEFTKSLNLNSFFLLGHSFGGRVAIKFSISWPQKIKALLLCSPAGIKQKWGIKEKFIWIIALIGNAFFAPKLLNRFKDKARHIFYKFLRNKDYAKAKGTMREIMKKVIDEDLLPYLSEIKVKTFIIWGEKDNVVPTKDAYTFKEKIKNSALEFLPKVHHSPHLEDPKKLSEVIEKFLLT